MHYNSAPLGAIANYPDSPGYRRNAPETSREAAAVIAPIAGNHRDKVLAALAEAHPESLCSEQIGEKVGLTPYAVRPRISELFADGQIERTEDRTKNEGGRSVMLWRLAK